MTVGPIAMNVPRSRSLIPTIKPFVSALIPRYMTKTLNIEEVLPLFYLGGLSNNDFIPAFEKLFGELPAGFSSASITRMKHIWQEEQRQWNHRPMYFAQYGYLWVDGIHFNLRLDEGRLCVLVVMRATEGRSKRTGCCYWWLPGKC
jgi:putative transposase